MNNTSTTAVSIGDTSEIMKNLSYLLTLIILAILSILAQWIQQTFQMRGINKTTDTKVTGILENLVKLLQPKEAIQ